MTLQAPKSFTVSWKICCAGRFAPSLQKKLNESFEKLWPSGIVYCAVHPSTSKQRLIRGIHNRINIEIGDVSTDGMYSSSHVSCA